MTLFHATLAALLEPIRALLDPSKRVFVPFLLGALGIALWAGARSGPRAAWTGQLFPRAIYLHPSAVLDYKLLFVKALLRTLLFAPRFLSTVSLTAAVTVGLRGWLGAAPSSSLSAVSVGVLYTLACFLFDDWSRYALHRAMHRFPPLWALHKVHHSAEVLTPLSLYRTHPIESLLNTLRGTLSLGLVSGVFVWGFGARVQGWQILGVDAIGFVWSLLGANLRHSHIWLSYGRRWEHIFLSPAQHQVHHSVAAAHRDRNFGTVLSMWDWLGGSLYTTSTREELRFGLTADEPRPRDTIVSLLLSPLRESLRAVQIAGLERRLRPLPVLALMALPLSCELGTRVDRAPLLRAFADCSVATYRDFAEAADLLSSATLAAADAPGAATLSMARGAWNAAIDRWQQAELLQIGPAATAPSLGAQGRRAAIYSWPEVNRCLIEQQLVNQTYQGELFAVTPENTRGLAALEYLLFYEGSDNTCEPSAAINSGGSWAALLPDELPRRKLAYAKATARDVAERAHSLLAAWQSEGFATQLASAGQGSTVFATQGAGLSAAAEALFYLDTMTKDRKLAMPLGLRDCALTSCPAATESTWARRGIPHLRNNLLGFRRLFLGCGPMGEGQGFDDLLTAAGASELATRMTADLDSALASVDALPTVDLATSITDHRDSVLRVYEAIKRITDALKTDFTAVLQITPPQRVEGDQD